MWQVPGRSGRVPIALAAMAVVAVGVLAACGSSGGGGGGGSAEFSGDAYPGVDVSNTRLAQGTIERSNAAQLEQAWTLPLTAKSTFGSYASTPVVAKGVIYSQDLSSNVQAISLESGEVLWEKKYEENDQGPNGVVVAEGKVFGATPTKAFALNQENGEELWSTPLLRAGNGEGESIDMAPGYHEGLVYVSTTPTNASASYPAGGVGILWALDAKTGKKAWHFNTVPESLWGDPKTNSGGGLWYPPSFDNKGFMYFGTGNPAPFPGTSEKPWGASRPGPDLYTDSMVKLNAKTGKMAWYYQLTPHDLYDWDFQDPPILTNAGGRELAIGAGKSGIVVAVDAETGKPVWKTPVGVHNGHDEDGLLAMNGETSKIKEGEVIPGTLGGVIAPMAANKTTVFAPIVNHPIEVRGGGSEISESPSAFGEVAALDIKTGKVKWTKKFEAPAYGAATAVNDLVFVTDSGGSVHALDANTGGEVWQGALPAGTNAGVTISGNTVLAPAGLPLAEGQTPEIVAYTIGGK
jgi:outer membrane protein assembly factor BamB